MKSTIRRRRRALAFGTVLITSLTFILGSTSTVSASVTVLCAGNSYATCINAGYTAHGFEQHFQSSYWGAYAGHNCTNYAAYMMTINGAATPNYQLGNASHWAWNASQHGVPVNQTPTAGAIAQWDSNAGGTGPDGHVAYVEAVNGNSITVSEDVYSTGPFRWRTITTGDAKWPTNFIHFKDQPNSNPGSSARHLSDVDHNGASDLVLVTNEPTGGSGATMLVSTWQGFWQLPAQWWRDPTVGWAGITPFVGDVNGDGNADYVFAANAGNGGVAVYVALSSGNGFGIPQLWWSGNQFDYNATKFSFGDVDGNGGDDLILSVPQPGGVAIYTMLSTYQGYWLQNQPWLTLSGWSWQHTTPMIADTYITVSPLNHLPDRAADLILLTSSTNGNAQAWVGASSQSSFVGPTLWWDGIGYGYTGIKPTTGDVDGNGASDLILVTDEPTGGSGASALLSTWQGFLLPQQRWRDTGTGWMGITPMVADVTADGKADFTFLANGGTASPIYVGPSTGASFGNPQLWWSGNGYGYNGIKPVLR